MLCILERNQFIISSPGLKPLGFQSLLLLPTGIESKFFSSRQIASSKATFGKRLCIETSTSLGSLQKFEDATSRVLARISKLPAQNSNFKISARPDLATNLLQILIPTTINSLVCQKGHFTLQPCHKRWFVRKIFGYYTPKVRIENSSWKFLPVQTGGF